MAQVLSNPEKKSRSEWVELTANAVHELARAVDKQARLSRKSYQQYGITENQGAILRLLLQGGPQSAIALSKRLYVTPSNMTGIIDRLETKGLILRSRQIDRRFIDIQLTEKGERLIQNLPDPLDVKLKWAVEKSEIQIPLFTLYTGIRSILDYIKSIES